MTDYILPLAVCLIWSVVVYKSAKISVLLLSLFFPLYLIRFNIASIPVYLIELLVLISAVPVFYKLFAGHHEILEKGTVSKLLYLAKSPFLVKKKPFREFLGSPFLPITLFIFAALIGSIIVPSDSYKHALGILKSWILIPIIYFFILYRTVKTKEDLQLVIYSYVGSAFVLSLIGMFQAVSGQYITVDSRVSGPFSSANYLAMYIAPALVFVSVRILQTFVHRAFESASFRFGSFERRIFLSGIVSILFVALILSQSYGGVVGVFVTIFAYIIYERFKAKNKDTKGFLTKLIVFITVVVVLGTTLVAILNVEKFQNLIKVNEHTSIATRLEIWQVGASLIKEHPILGIGLGEYEKEYKNRASELLGHEPYEMQRLHSHNLYMETWLNTGITGFVAFLWLLVLTFIHIRKTFALFSAEMRQITVAVSMMLIYILLHGLVDVQFWKNDLAFLFWMIIAVMLVLAGKLKHS
ncbi:O-antigen ligase family protein [bacterium]|nr:O-antigen ligase family protein [bacterium]